MIEWELTGQCRSYAEVPEGARITYVNGRSNFGSCEGCGKPVLDDQDFSYDEEGIVWHTVCPRERKRR